MRSGILRTLVSETLWRNVVQGNPGKFRAPWEERGLLGNRILGSWMWGRPLETTLSSFSPGTVPTQPCANKHQVCKVSSDRGHTCSPSCFWKVLCTGTEAELKLLLLFLSWVLISPSGPTWIYVKSKPLFHLEVHLMVLILRLCSLTQTSPGLSAVHPVTVCSGCLHLSRGPVSQSSFLTAVCQGEHNALTLVGIQTVQSTARWLIWVGHPASFKAAWFGFHLYGSMSHFALLLRFWEWLLGQSSGFCPVYFFFFKSSARLCTYFHCLFSCDIF